MPPSWASSADERAQPRAVRPDPGRPAGHRRLRRRVHPAPERALQRLADLRRDLPRPVPGRPHLHPPDAAPRRPVPVPAGGAAGELRDRDGLPDRLHARAPAGAVVRGRAGPVRGHDHRLPGLSQARAVPLHRSSRSRSSCWSCRGCRGSARRSTAPTWRSRCRAASASSRPSSPRSAWSSSWPATCATPARRWCSEPAGSSA